MWIKKHDYVVVAVYNWAGSVRHGLRLAIGDCVCVLEENAKWYRGYKLNDRTTLGIFPASYVRHKQSRAFFPDTHQRPHISDTRSDGGVSGGANDGGANISQQVVAEVTDTLREWSHKWKHLYIRRCEAEVTSLWKLMHELLHWRRQLLTGTLTQDRLREMMLRITAKIDWGNRQLELDLVPRDSTGVINGASVSPVALYQVHSESLVMLQDMSNRGTIRKKCCAAGRLSCCSLLVSLRQFSYTLLEDVQLLLTLYDRLRAKFVSETFEVVISNNNNNNNNSCVYNKLNNNILSVIFTELGNVGADTDLVLVIRALRVGRMHAPTSTPTTTTSAVPSNSCSTSSLLSLASSSSSSADTMMSRGSSSRSSTQLPPSSVRQYRRPLGCAVVDLSAVMSSSSSSSVSDGTSNTDDRQTTARLFQCDERDYHQLHEILLSSRQPPSKCTPVYGPANYGILLSLRVLHGSVEQLHRDSRVYLQQSSVVCRKLGFPDVIMPGDFRNDLYLTLDRAEFERAGRSTGKNVEVVVLVVSNDGRVLQDCVVMGSGVVGGAPAAVTQHSTCRQHRSLVLYHNNTPRWNETIKLSVPLDMFSTAHIRLEYSHCSSSESRLSKDKGDKKLFGFSFVCLMSEDGPTVRDGCHELCVYKCTDRQKLTNPLLYLGRAWRADMLSASGGGSGSGQFSRSSKELVFVSTLLCSTKLTQNIDLLSLLKWKQSPNRIIETLTKVMNLRGEEVVKFLQDVLDSLFAMFSSENGTSTPYSGLVFQVLVSIFSHLLDSKFEHFRPVLDAYISDHFSAALVYKGLMSCVRHYAEQVEVQQHREPLVLGFRVLEFVVQFIIRSRRLFSQQSGEVASDAEFRADLCGVFNAFNRLLSLSSPAVAASQVALLQSIPGVCMRLRVVLCDAELSRRLALMFESLPRDNTTTCTSVTTAINKHKMNAMRTVVKSALFDDPESRGVLLHTICKHVRFHLSEKQEVAVCVDLLSDIVDFLHRQRQQNQTSVESDVTTVCTYLCDTLVQAVSSARADGRGAGTGGGMRARLLVLFTAVLCQMSDTHYKRLWSELADVCSLLPFMQRSMTLLTDLLDQEDNLLPADWFVMRMEINRTLGEFIVQLAGALCSRFITASSRSANVHLVVSFVRLSVTFVTQRNLQLETFSDVKRLKTLAAYGDLRLAVANQVMNIWKSLGASKSCFIPTLVGSALEVSLVPQQQLRRLVLPIFYDMMLVEFVDKHCFKQVETELIDKLDILISENKGDDEYRRLFNQILLHEVEHGDEQLQETGAVFVQSVTRLLERLLDYRRVMCGDENRDKRISCTVNLLNFYKSDIDRGEMYQRYIYKLLALHESAENHAEAAFTLRLHADQLSWSSRVLHADHLYPVQCEWQRKEQLILQVVEYLDRARCWEAGVPLLRELAELYEHQLFDYAKLSSTLHTMARFYQHVVDELRVSPEYFRVGFYGQALPLFVRNKVFVYRGQQYEKLSSFTQRLQVEFPEARLMTTLTEPDQLVMNSDVQLMQICNVRAVSDYAPVSTLVEVPDKVSAYHHLNDVDTFLFDRPVPRPVDSGSSGGRVASDNEFGNMWLERVTLRTEARLPGILRWFCVVDTRRQLISPVQHGCEAVQAANRHLRQLTALCSDGADCGSVNLLTMRLQGTIDAAVNGGLANFQETFFTAEYASENPELVPQIQHLKNLISEQLSLLDGALEVHGHAVSDSLQPLHRRLVECFHCMRSSFNQSVIGSSNTAPSTPPPGDLHHTPAAVTVVSSSDSVSHVGVKLNRLSSQRTSVATIREHNTTTTTTTTTASPDISAGDRKPSIISTPLPPVPVGRSCGAVGSIVDRVSCMSRASSCTTGSSISAGSSYDAARLSSTSDYRTVVTSSHLHAISAHHHTASDYEYDDDEEVAGEVMEDCDDGADTSSTLKHHEYIFISVGDCRNTDTAPCRPPKRISVDSGVTLSPSTAVAVSVTGTGAYHTPASSSVSWCISSAANSASGALMTGGADVSRPARAVSAGTAPPLPPKPQEWAAGMTSVSSGVTAISRDIPPSLPSRSHKKASMTSLHVGSVDAVYGDLHSPPPPLPPKTPALSPLSCNNNMVASGGAASPPPYQNNSNNNNNNNNADEAEIYDNNYVLLHPATTCNNNNNNNNNTTGLDDGYIVLYSGNAAASNKR